MSVYYFDAGAYKAVVLAYSPEEAHTLALASWPPDGAAMVLSWDVLGWSYGTSDAPRVILSTGGAT